MATAFTSVAATLIYGFAAAAIRRGVPLVAHDAAFIGCPGLELRTQLVS